MKRFLPVLAATLLLVGCGSTPIGSETAREVVLQYLGTDVGTAGPFSKTAKNELDVLTPADRQKAASLIDGGAVLFLVYTTPTPGETAKASRVVLVKGKQVVGDFNTAKTAP